MSHFSVVVCIDGSNDLIKHARYAEEHQGMRGLVRGAVEECIKRVMAPFDENKDMEPYRVYEKGDASDHWLYSSLKRAAEDYAAGTGIKPYDPDALGWSSASSKQTPEEQRAKQKADADLLAALPDPVTWADLAKLYAERYAEEDSGKLLVDESGRGYTMSTYNPESKWDYWRIGGRWGGYFPFKENCRDQVIQIAGGWDSPENMMPDHCDGGPKSALDLDRLRTEKADEARKTLAEYAAAVAGTPEAMSWSSFRENVSEATGYTIDRARDEYHSQPRVQVLSRNERFRWTEDVIGQFSVGEKRYVTTETARAVPGYAIVTTDGRWMAPGKMGWFGMSTEGDSDRIGYWETANAYIEALPDDAWLVAVDCHI